MFVQARMESGRLPGKVARPLSGQPMILRQLDRLSRSKTCEKPILLTAATAPNEQLLDLARKHGYKADAPEVGENDVLARFWCANFTMNPNNVPIVRITGDCPLIDVAVVDELVDMFNNDNNMDYASLGPEWADGLDCEIFTSAALNMASNRTTNLDREHVTPYMYKSGLLKCGRLPCPFDMTNERWCVDDERDFMFVSRIFEELETTPNFGWREVLGVVNYLRLNLVYPNRENRNQGYLKQAGINESWEEFRFGK